MTDVLTATSLLQKPEPTASGQLQLADSTFKVLASLRHLAGRRSTLLVRCIADGQLLVLKLFVAQGKGQQEFERELAVHAYCRSHHIDVADIEMQINTDQDVNAIAYQYLPKARTLAQMDFAEQPIADLFKLFACCHQADCLQQDPHLDNFALSEGKLYLLDLASVALVNKPLTMTACLNNLAGLLVQWPEHKQADLRAYLPNYFTVRQQAFTDRLSAQLEACYKKSRSQHQRHYLKKQLRNCTMTAYRKTLWHEAAWRKGIVDSLQADTLESLMQAGQPLKLGNSATVMLSTLEAQPVVIKRYNIKNFGHWLSRCLRPSRARTSWLNANLLEYAGIATPQPLGFVEQRWLGLRRRAYFVSRQVVGQPLLALSEAELCEPALLAQLKNLFVSLRQHRLVHGDMKANNLLVDTDGQLWLLDLDAMRQVPSRKFAELHKQDQRRFMQNWHGRDIETQLRKVIEAA